MTTAPLIACPGCRVPLALEAALVRMGQTDLFVCPSCGHQAVWRKA